MLKNYLLLASCLGTMCVQAQTVIYSENFESYVTDSLLEPQSADWFGWGGETTPAEVSSEIVAFSGANCLKGWQNSSPGTTQTATDVVSEFGNFNSGKYELTMQLYAPSEDSTGNSNTSYYNIMHRYPTDWAFEIAFFPKGTSPGAQIKSAGIYTDFEPLHDQWVEIRHIIDIENDELTIYYDGTLIYTGAWSNGLGGTNVSSALGAINIYQDVAGTCLAPATNGQWGSSGNCTPLTYIDDIRLTDITGVDVSVAELQNDLQIGLFPNPAQQQITLEGLDQLTSPTSRIIIADMVGKVVHVEEAFPNQPKETLDVSNLDNGNYVVTILSDHYQANQALVIAR